MRRVTIEYTLLPGDRFALREREEQRWITSEVVLALPNSAKVKVEVLDEPLVPETRLPRRRASAAA